MGWGDTSVGPYGDAWFVDQQPAHSVTLSAFHLDQAEVTVASFARFLTHAAGELHFDVRQPVERVRDGYLPAAWTDDQPIRQVTWAAARDYCRWAGKRLPSEPEWEAASSWDPGTGVKRPYPWGDAPPSAGRANLDAMHFQPAEVGTYPQGVSPIGCWGMIGDVWEWTSSPYVAPDKFRKNKYKVDGKKREFTPRWNGNQRIVVGGSFQNPRYAARCTVRRGTPRDEVTNAMGFRIAASASAGVDIANSLFNTEVKHSDHRPNGVIYAPDQVIAKDRWMAQPGGDGAPEHYEIIEDYQYILFVPRAELEETQGASFRRDSLEAPAHLGFLSIREPMLQPALAPGSYLVAFRAAGETPEPTQVEGREEADSETPVLDSLLEGLDLNVDNLLLIHAETGERAAGFQINGLAFGKGDAGGGWSKIIKTHKEVDPDNPRKQIEISEDWLRCDIRLATKIRRRSLIFGLEMMPDPSHFAHKWRK